MDMPEPPYGPRSVVFEWTIHEAEEIRAATKAGWEPLRDLRLDIIHLEPSPVPLTCWVVASLPYQVLFDAVERYKFGGGVNFESQVKGELKRLLGGWRETPRPADDHRRALLH